MKIFQYRLLFWYAFLLLFLGSNKVFALQSFGPQCSLDNLGNAVAVWNAIDNNGNTILQGSTMTGSTWSTPVNISYSISTNISNNTPTLYHSTNGDAIVIWQYVDNLSSNFYIAASILPVGSTSWNTASVSLNSENANYGDQRLAMNSLGNLMLMWTSTINNDAQIRVATSSIGSSTTWTTPTSITQ